MFELRNVILPPCGFFLVNSETKSGLDKAGQINHRGFVAAAEGEMGIWERVWKRCPNLTGKA